MYSLSQNRKREYRLSENGFGLAKTGSRDESRIDPAEEATRETDAFVIEPVKRRQGGRPQKPASKRRTHKYLVSANDTEADAIEAAAAANSLKPSVYLRQAGTGARLSKRRDEILFHRISRIGVRLQQLARSAGDAGRIEEQEALEALLQEVLEVRADL